MPSVLLGAKMLGAFLEDAVRSPALCSSVSLLGGKALLPTMREGSTLSRFPHEPSPSLSSVPNIQTPILEYRITNIVPQFPNLINLLREDSNLIRIRRAIL
jgi:hypothetical protein